MCLVAFVLWPENVLMLYYRCMTYCVVMCCIVCLCCDVLRKMGEFGVVCR